MPTAPGDDAEARRVVDLPELSGTTEPESGPSDHWRTFLPLFTGALTAFTLLGTLALYASAREAWILVLLLVPVALPLATLAALYRAARRPYE